MMTLEDRGQSTPHEDPHVDIETSPHAQRDMRTKRRKKVREDEGTYGSFFIDETEFAIPVSAIQEVVNEPEQLTELPMSPPFQTGLFNLRGAIIPLIDLRRLLEFPEKPASGKGKVTIIENGALSIGLLFDDTGEVIQAADASRIDFNPTSDGIKDVVVEGLLKFEGGDRVVQILDPFELLNIEKLPRIPKDQGKKVEKSNLGRRMSCLSFELGHTTCAIDLNLVQEVMDVPDVEKCCFSDGYLLGTVNLRGYTLPVIDFRGMFGEEKPFQFSQEALKNRKLLVMTLPEGLIGLLVYSIESIIPYYEDDVLQFTQVSLPRHDVVSGCLLNDAGELVIMIDSERLAKDAELVRAAQSCQEIFPPETEGDGKPTKAAELRRRTFILFSVEKCFALDIGCVSEVIEKPKNLLAPPYSLPFVEGIINLRGELITLIDPRLLYGFPEGNSRDLKVLIFIQDGQKYGIQVDSVDEIVMTTDACVVDVPAISEKSMSRTVSEDLLGCLSTPNDRTGADPVIILNTASLISRCVNKA